MKVVAGELKTMEKQKSEREQQNSRKFNPWLLLLDPAPIEVNYQEGGEGGSFNHKVSRWS
jgi:hypothetical protein